MPILRLAYTTLFLIALLAVFELWSQVGGQSHLDLMPWYLKLVLGTGAAFSVVKAAAAAVAGERAWNRQTLRWAGILLVLLIGCGLASYYVHLYGEEDEQDDQNVSRSGKVHSRSRVSRPEFIRARAPSSQAAGPPTYAWGSLPRISREPAGPPHSGFLCGDSFRATARRPHSSDRVRWLCGSPR